MALAPGPEEGLFPGPLPGILGVWIFDETAAAASSRCRFSRLSVSGLAPDGPHRRRHGNPSSPVRRSLRRPFPRMRYRGVRAAPRQEVTTTGKAGGAPRDGGGDHRDRGGEPTLWVVVELAGTAAPTPTEMTEPPPDDEKSSILTLGPTEARFWAYGFLVFCLGLIIVAGLVMGREAIALRALASLTTLMIAKLT